ncbi:hypothetical protein [Pseudobacteriovorax antillogorgiicola]|uniref:PilZ domain-containing protein n=1 Tax=Pseudobacteriovorax antillogorgiicola TaxID=1513793 RepID=A0A1Y6CIY2_9BACT|nr:hypothetical protein [Pseudobacteriovorax antillogorgiicola]TCS46409.1 hypothetical protein EDD56_12473 [Pseudobacteriovorax antillogorgiicola]SMF68885.1 hypothetical protein SAMN06296036_12473 [Pseudobacteriovorax antillogorgiicola]
MSGQAVRRRYIRAAPDDNEYVQIDHKLEGDFTFSYAALVVEESPLGGCSIVCLDSVGLEKGSVCRMKVGHMAPLRSEIVWVKVLDEHVVRLGVKFLE